MQNEQTNVTSVPDSQTVEVHEDDATLGYGNPPVPLDDNDNTPDKADNAG